MQTSEEDKFDIAHFVTHLFQQNYSGIKLINGNTEYICLNPLLFTTAIIKGDVGNYMSYNDRWCYHSAEAAAEALEAWDGEGEPEGWHRHPLTGRRREIAEDGSFLETINP